MFPSRARAFSGCWTRPTSPCRRRSPIAAYACPLEKSSSTNANPAATNDLRQPTPKPNSGRSARRRKLLVQRFLDEMPPSLPPLSVNPCPPGVARSPRPRMPAAAFLRHPGDHAFGRGRKPWRISRKTTHTILETGGSVQPAPGRAAGRLSSNRGRGGLPPKR